MAEFERIEKVSHLRIFTHNIKIRKFMISCFDPESVSSRCCGFVFKRNGFYDLLLCFCDLRKSDDCVAFSRWNHNLEA